MKLNIRPKILLTAILLAVTMIAPLFAEALAKKPNIIYILTDDWGIGKVPTYKMGVSGLVKTPNLDQMAKDGVTFTRAYAGNAVCGPSRASLISGQHSGHCGIRANTSDRKALHPLWPPKDGTTLGETAQKAGYVTACFGKIGAGTIVSKEEMNAHGWDHWEGYLSHRRAYNYYPNYIWRNGEKYFLKKNNTPEMIQTFGAEYADSAKISRKNGGYQKIGRVMGDKGTFSENYFADQALNFIKNNKENEKPFFIYFASQVPHGGPPGLSVPDIKVYENEHRLNAKEKVYAAAMTHHDANVGRIRELLKELDLEDNTIIIWSADNGDESSYYGFKWDLFKGTGPFRANKRFLYEGGIQVPALAVWPKNITPGSISDFIWASYDLVPTFAEIGRLSKLPSMDGISILPLLKGQPEKADRREYLYYEFYERGKQQAVVFKDWKAYRLNGLKGKIELYRINEDISEKNNLADQYPELVINIEKIMLEEHTPHPVLKLPGYEQTAAE